MRKALVKRGNAEGDSVPLRAVQHNAAQVNIRWLNDCWQAELAGPEGPRI
jgi:hypothetical protein